MITPGENESWTPLVQEGWGKDGIVCVFSKMPAEDVLAQLRSLCRAKEHGHDDGQTVFGYCWPSILGFLLMNFSKEFLGRLMTGVEAILVEFPDFPESWQLFGNEQIKDVLRGFGLKPQRNALDAETEPTSPPA